MKETSRSPHLYLTPLRKPRPSVWYSLQPVGESKIKTYMMTMASLAGIDKSGNRYTNHSVHKTTLQKLQKVGISNDKIAAFTGHKREQTLRDYATIDMEDHQKISKIFSSKKSDVAVPQPIVSRTFFIHQPVPPSVCF